ncbi:hypothetical protein, partial [Arthrobacter sp. 260]|uniref:hypothetical protein n=1 Tax=Arthrobacter sp. 260 TaxID=2735314 RepID=UPI0017AFF036
MIAGLSVKDQAGKMPYAVAVSPRNVLGWVYDGAELVQLRIMWSREEREEFGSKQAPQVRVYDKFDNGVFLRVYEERDNADKQKE